MKIELVGANDIVSRLWRWAMGARWRTWMFHGLFAALLAPVLGSWPVIVFFLLCEVKEIMEKRALGITPDYGDHFGDFAVPFVVAILQNAFLGV